MNVALTLLPDFSLIALGLLIARLLTPDTWRGLDRLSYFVLYPGLIFHAASARPVALGEVLVLGGAAFAVLSVGLAAGLATRSLRASSDVDFGGVLQNAYRFNTALAFVAIGVLPADAAGALAVMIGCAIPLVNVYAVIGLTRGRDVPLRVVLREVTTNPFLLASVAGLGVALSGITLPTLVDQFATRLSAAALPLVLLSIGAALSRARLWPLERQAFAIHLIRLLLLPSLVLVVALVLDLRSVPVATLLLFAAMPTATAAHVLANRYGADRAAVALMVTQSSLFGLITLPLWANVAVRLVG